MIRIKATIEVTLPDGEIISDLIDLDKPDSILRSSGLTAFWLICAPEAMGRRVHERVMLLVAEKEARNWGRRSETAESHSANPHAADASE